MPNYAAPITMATRRKRSEHYVNNKEFLGALEVYFAAVERAALEDKPKPQIPRYIGATSGATFSSKYAGPTTKKSHLCHFEFVTN